MRDCWRVCAHFRQRAVARHRESGGLDAGEHDHHWDARPRHAQEDPPGICVGQRAASRQRPRAGLPPP